MEDDRLVLIKRILIHSVSNHREGDIAQSVERWSNKPLVVGSIPTITNYFLCLETVFREEMKIISQKMHPRDMWTILSLPFIPW